MFVIGSVQLLGLVPLFLSNMDLKVGTLPLETLKTQGIILVVSVTIMSFLISLFFTEFHRE